MSISRPERPPLSVEYLFESGTPVIIQPAEGIVAIVSGDGYETVDMTVLQFLDLFERMKEWIG